MTYKDKLLPLSMEAAEDIFRFLFDTSSTRVSYFGVGRLSHVLILSFYQYYISGLCNTSSSQKALVEISPNRTLSGLFGTVEMSDLYTPEDKFEDFRHFETHNNKQYIGFRISQLLPHYVISPMPYVLEGFPFDSVFSHSDLLKVAYEKSYLMNLVYEGSRHRVKTFIFCDYGFDGGKNESMEYLLSNGFSKETKSYFLKSKDNEIIYNVRDNKPMKICDIHYLINENRNGTRVRHL